jgi:hypothetical protein
VQVLNGQVYVTYALQNAFKHDDVGGPHHGFVDVYNLDGTGGKRLISGGPLDSPWGPRGRSSASRPSARGRRYVYRARQVPTRFRSAIGAYGACWLFQFSKYSRLAR